MKIDFRKIVVNDIEGNVLMKEVEKRDSEGNIVGTERVIDYKDVSKDLGNAIYFNVSDIKDQQIGRKLYLEGEIEVDGPTAALIKKFADQIFYAYVKFPLFKLLDSALNQNKE